MTGFRLHFRRPLDAFQLDVDVTTPSERVGVVGPSGSGKSTLIRVVVGVDRTAVGEIEVGGETWQASGAGAFVPAWRRRVGWVPQDVLLFPHLSVRENLEFGTAVPSPAQKLHPAGEPPTLEAIARMLEIEPLLKRRSREISGGERQRVALGRALLARPGVLLLDEPFSALDADLRWRVVGALADHLSAQGIKLLLVTHDRTAADPLIQEWWTVSNGRLDPTGR